MSTKHYCDKCGRELKDFNDNDTEVRDVEVSIPIKFHNGKHWDRYNFQFCNSCQNKLLKWLKDK